LSAIVRVREIGILVSAIASAACGTRTGLHGYGPAADVGVDDASATDTATDSALDTAIDVAPACTWSIAGAARRVSGEPIVPGDVGLMDAVPTTGGALVAWRTAGTKEQPQTLALRLVAFDPTHDGDEHTILRAPDVVSTVDDVSLAVGHGHDGVVGTTGKSCSFHPITLDGASNGSTKDQGGGRCLALGARPEGFQLLVGRPSSVAPSELVLRALDPAGAARGADVSLRLFEPEARWGDRPRFARYDDGSFLALLTADGGFTTEPFDATGAQTAPARFWVPESGVFASAIAPTASGAVAAYAAARTTSTGRATVTVTVPLDRDGVQSGQATVLVRRDESIDASFVSAVTLAPDPSGGAFAGWTEAVRAAYVQPVDDLGRPRAAPLLLAPTLAGAQFAPVIRIVAIDRQGFAIFDASTDATPHRVYAVPLRCD
jgi:hypothetical protein